ncbi:hypothetical protein B0H12DRAFT_694575 [Mycena haematopus]|nr:hypothetical protein B0H12DRAFT_694575 [Mycena haematopus]
MSPMHFCADEFDRASRPHPPSQKTPWPVVLSWHPPSRFVPSSLLSWLPHCAPEFSSTTSSSSLYDALLAAELDDLADDSTSSGFSSAHLDRPRRSDAPSTAPTPTTTLIWPFQTVPPLPQNTIPLLAKSSTARSISCPRANPSIPPQPLRLPLLLPPRTRLKPRLRQRSPPFSRTPTSGTAWGCWSARRGRVAQRGDAGEYADAFECRRCEEARVRRRRRGGDVPTSSTSSPSPPPSASPSLSLPLHHLHLHSHLPRLPPLLPHSHQHCPHRHPHPKHNNNPPPPPSPPHLFTLPVRAGVIVLLAGCVVGRGRVTGGEKGGGRFSGFGWGRA